MNHLAVFLLVCGAIGFSEVNHLKQIFEKKTEIEIMNFDVSFIFISKE